MNNYFSKRFLSWDCANKTLAWAYIEINLKLPIQDAPLNDNLTNIKQRIDNIMRCLDNVINVISVGSIDLIDGKKIKDVSEIERSRLLYKFLHNSKLFSCDNLPKDTTVIIEHQPPRVGFATNNKSVMIEHQLLFYYHNFNLIQISPCHKQKIYFRDLTFNKFIEEKKKKSKILTRSNHYVARKKHSKMNFLHFIDEFNHKDKIANIPKKTLDDVADAFLQILAHIKLNRNDPTYIPY